MRLRTVAPGQPVCDHLFIPQGVLFSKVHLHGHRCRPRGPAEVANRQRRVHQDRPASARTSGGQQLCASATVGKSQHRLSRCRVRDGRPAASEHFVKSQFLDFADGIHPVVENLAVVKVGRVYGVAGMSKPFSPLQHPGPESVCGMKQRNLQLGWRRSLKQRLIRHSRVPRLCANNSRTKEESSPPHKLLPRDWQQAIIRQAPVSH